MTQTPAEKHDYFLQVPNFLIEASDLPETFVIGFLRMTRRFGRKGFFRGSIRKLSSLLGMPRMTIARMIPALEKAGLIRKERLPKEDEKRDEMCIHLCLQAMWERNTEYYKGLYEQCPKLGQQPPHESAEVSHFGPTLSHFGPTLSHFGPTLSHVSAQTLHGNIIENITENKENTNSVVAVATNAPSPSFSSDETFPNEEATFSPESPIATKKGPSHDFDSPGHHDFDHCGSDHRDVAEREHADSRRDLETASVETPAIATHTLAPEEKGPIHEFVPAEYHRGSDHRDVVQREHHAGLGDGEADPDEMAAPIATTRPQTDLSFTPIVHYGSEPEWQEAKADHLEALRASWDALTPAERKSLKWKDHKDTQAALWLKTHPKPHVPPRERAMRRELQAKINEWRGYSLDDAGQIVRESQAIIPLARRLLLFEQGDREAGYTLDDLKYTLDEAKRQDDFWKKPENTRRAGAVAIGQKAAEYIHARRAGGTLIEMTTGHASNRYTHTSLPGGKPSWLLSDEEIEALPTPLERKAARVGKRNHIAFVEQQQREVSAPVAIAR